MKWDIWALLIHSINRKYYFYSMYWWSRQILKQCASMYRWMQMIYEAILRASFSCFDYISYTRKYILLRISCFVLQLCTKVPDFQYGSWYARTKSIRQRCFLCHLGLLWNSPFGTNRGKSQRGKKYYMSVLPLYLEGKEKTKR